MTSPAPLLADPLYNTSCEETISDDPEADAVPTRFGAALGEIYGDRLERVVLYCSRARGDHRPDSDYNIAVFIKDPGTLGEEIRRLAEVETDMLTDTGAVINALPFRAGGRGSPGAHGVHARAAARRTRLVKSEAADCDVGSKCSISVS
jgi:predicted nucleotidyltransferase